MPSGSYSQTYLPFASDIKYKFSNPPNPSWKLGQRVDATPQGQEWMKGLENCAYFDLWVNSVGQIYEIMISGIVPRPIAFVSSISEDGVGNLGCFRSPPTLLSSLSFVPTSHRETRLSDTARNIHARKGFTVNIISEPWVQNANACSVDAPYEVDEWPLSGLTKEPSIYVKAPRVKESAFSMECELLHFIDMVQPDTLKATTTLFLATVKYIHIRKDMLDERGVVDAAKLMPVSRLGDVSFGRLTEGFRIPMPRWANIADEVKDILGEDTAPRTKGLRLNEEGRGTGILA